MLSFPDGFLWGTGASSFQTEGGLDNNDWYFWTRDDMHRPAPQRRFAEPAGRGTDFWNRYEEDLDLAAEIGVGFHRLSTEWARVVPRPGRPARDALAHYRRILEAMRARDIRVMLTMHHFSVPDWLAADGYFQDSARAVPHFAEYARLVVEELGDLVDFWVPVNEPSMVAWTGHYAGLQVPFQTSFPAAVRAFNTLARMHAVGYRAVKDARAAGPVGRAYSWFRHVPYDGGSAVDRAAAWVNGHVANESFFRGVRTGRLGPPYELPFRPAVPELEGTLDWVGVNYYSETYARGTEFVLSKPGEKINDLGAHLAPTGLYDALVWVHRTLGLPAMITENGAATVDERVRIAYVDAHLREVHRAIGAGVDVRGYTHWSLTDNWEMQHGYESRFGLVAVDPVTLDRTLKEGGRWYAGVVAQNGLPDAPAPYPAGPVPAPSLRSAAGGAA